MEQVILVDTNDNELGAMEKMEAHRKGILHRAFSVLVFNSKGEMLIQKRADHKYHSAGLWTNTCCSHPRPSESVPDAAQRRLKEEMGIVAPVEFAYSFIYKAVLDDGLIEHELDYVYTAVYDEKPLINPSEVSDWRFADLNTLHFEILEHPERFTTWFKLIINHPNINSFIPVQVK